MTDTNTKTNSPVLNGAQHAVQKGENPAGRLSVTYKSLDMWRGLAALWVAMYHTMLVVTRGHSELNGNTLYVFSKYGYLGVQMFFVISGYCIIAAACRVREKDNAWHEFIKARLRRIYPPYWFAALCAATISLIAAQLVAHHIFKSSNFANKDVLHHNMHYYFTNLTLTQVLLHDKALLAQCWTLCYEMAFYIIVGIMLLNVNGWKRWFRSERAILNTLHAITVLCLIFLIAAPQHRIYPFDMWPQFGLGVLLYDLVNYRSHIAGRYWGIGIVLLTTLFIVLYHFPIGPMWQPSSLSYLLSLIFAGLLLILSKYDSVLSKRRPVQWLTALGLFSYSLYLTHTFSIGLVNQMVARMHLPASMHWLSFLLTIIGAIVFARIFYAYCEKPFVKNRKSSPKGDVVKIKLTMSSREVN